mmetsp:Transcript_19849/g.60040  ORF Transcript_19849/g.60040 Transcript_19849/m.60040 type:complete len:205 (+) Transcript_19849:1-615(+)
MANSMASSAAAKIARVRAPAYSAAGPSSWKIVRAVPNTPSSPGTVSMRAKVVSSGWEASAPHAPAIAPAASDTPNADRPSPRAPGNDVNKESRQASKTANLNAAKTTSFATRAPNDRPNKPSYQPPLSRIRSRNVWSNGIGAPGRVCARTFAASNGVTTATAATAPPKDPATVAAQAASPKSSVSPMVRLRNSVKPKANAPLMK